MGLNSSPVGCKAVVASVACSVIILTYAWYFGKVGGVRKDEKQFIQILCFGDSLTRGLTNKNGVRGYHPYSLALTKYLSNKGLKRSHQGKFIVHNRGINGEEVCRSMENRLPTLLKNTQYDWVIILGGANDLRVMHEGHPNGKYPQKLYQPIIDALIKLHQNVHQHGGKTVAITIPGRQCERRDCKELKVVRLWLNDRIREFAAKFKDRVVLADLDKEMGMDKFLKYWVDEVHYTLAGYDRMGQIIYNALHSSL